MEKAETKEIGKQSKEMVKFLDLLKEYVCGHDIVCLIAFSSEYKIKESDQICLFRTEEVNPKGFYRPASLCLFPVSENVFTLRFPANAYKYCHGNHIFNYISGNREIVANSEAFTLIKGDPVIELKENDIISMASMASASSVKSAATSGSFIETAASNEEVQKLREENYLLRESLKLFVNEKCHKDCNKSFSELKSMIGSLRDEVFRDRQQLSLVERQVAICLQLNRELLSDRFRLEREFRRSSMSSSVPATSEDFDSLSEYDPGELEAIPPFPFAK